MDRNNEKNYPCQCFWSAVGRTQNFGHNDDGLTKVLYCDCDCDCDVLLVLLRGSMIDTTTRKCGRDWWTTKFIATTWKSRCRKNDYNDCIGRSSINSWKGLVCFGWVHHPPWSLDPVVRMRPIPYPHHYQYHQGHSPPGVVKTMYLVRLIRMGHIPFFERGEWIESSLLGCHIGKKVGFPWHMRDNVGHTTPGWTGLDIILRPTKDCPNGHSFQQDGVIVWPSRIRSITTLVIKTRASGLFHFKPHVLTKRCCWANIFHIDAIAKWSISRGVCEM